MPLGGSSDQDHGCDPCGQETAGRTAIHLSSKNGATASNWRYVAGSQRCHRETSHSDTITVTIISNTMHGTLDCFC